MEILKPNDILVATLNSPDASAYDLMSSGFDGENTSMFTKDEYKNSSFIKKAFTDESGKFNDAAFDAAYNQAQQKYYDLTSDQYLSNLDKIQYSPFDLTRPKGAKTFDVSTKIEKEYNPFKQLYGWTGIGSIDENPLSLRELAQQNKVFDPATNTWSKESAADLTLFDKLFGETLVYAQWDEDGSHFDNQSGRNVEHKKGDWKIDDNGNLFLEKLAGREVYGKQVVNPMDILTTEGSVFDKFNFLDSDDREKSIAGTVFKTATEIAPYFIPEFGIFKGAAAIRSLYGGLNAGIGLAAAMPTFYKAMEGLLLGDENTLLTKGATKMEGWMSKLTASSTSDEGSSSAFSFEQMSSMVGSIFSQIHEQRAMASLSKILVNADSKLDSKALELGEKINRELVQNALEGKIDFNDIGKLSKAAMQKIPELESVIKQQNTISKALSLGYMALTSTSDIYGEALQGGYDRRTAGFAALAAASGQYAIMMNNRMGDWFLDKTTGYNIDTNRSLIKEALTPYFEKTKDAFNLIKSGSEKDGKRALGQIFKSIRTSIGDIFTTPSVVGEAMWKNAVVEGVEEVTEQAVLDATKGIVDTMSYLGLTKKQGTFGGWDTAFSKAGFENYLANFVGGIVGGGLFEFHHQKIEPLFDPSALAPETKKSLYDLIADGKKEDIIKAINDQRSNLGNKYLTPIDNDGKFQEANEKNKISQADLISNQVIGMVEQIDGILNGHDFIQSDEEIIKKAIRDEIIITNLKKTAQEGSSIGIEGLVLDDIKSRMANVVDIESKIQKLTDEEKTSEIGKSLKAQLKINVDYVNDILEGKKSSDYFRKSVFYLNNKINKAFINVDKANYTKSVYGSEYSSLPDTGAGITKQLVDKEWSQYIDSVDLRKDLDTADKMYLEIEKLLNSDIAKYVDSGYIEEHKKTLNNLQDLRRTIDAFNIEESLEKKELIFKNFIEINNKLAKEGNTLTGPWTVLHDKIYDNLKDLGLVKKLDFVENEEGQLVPQETDFTEEELNNVLPNGLTLDEHYKSIIKDYFKNFPSNPLMLGSMISSFNAGVNEHNANIDNEIKKVLLEPDSEEKQNKLNALESSKLNIKLNGYESLKEVSDLKNEFETNKRNLILNNQLSEEDYQLYESKKDAGFDKNLTFEKLLSDFNVTDVNDLSADQMLELIEKMIESNYYGEIFNRIEKSSKGAFEEIDKALLMLESGNLTEDQLTEVKEKLATFFDFSKSVINNTHAILNDNVYKEVNDKIVDLTNKLNSEVESLKPELFKIKNYALDLTTKELKNGNLDEEAFIFAQNLFDEESGRFLSKIFPKLSNLKYTETIEFIDSLQDIVNELSKRNNEEDPDIEDLTSEKTLAKIIEEEEFLLSQPNGKSSLFKDINVLNFVKNNYDLTITGDIFSELIRSSLKSYNSEKGVRKSLDNFIEVATSGLKLKTNPLYNFIKNFALTLNSNPNNKVAKIFEILEKEITILRSSSNITNYTSDGIRESDINQAIDLLEMIKSVVYAMSTTTVDYEDPIGFIKARQEFAKRNKIDDDVVNLKTINSDVATLMIQDVDLISSKLKFLKELSLFNSGKMENEQEITKDAVEEILLSNWRDWIKNMKSKFYPTEKINSILNSNKSNSSKLMDIEVEIFNHNKNQKEEALEEFLKLISNVDPDKITPINRDVKTLSGWDSATYFATTLSINSRDFYIRSLTAINGNFNKAPFFTQEFASKITKASTVNPELFSKIYDIKQNSNKYNGSFITVILGNAGTGKTSAVFGLDLEHFRQTNENTKIWLSAPTDLQTNNLDEAINNSIGKEKLETEKLIKDELFKKLGIKSLVDKIEQEVLGIADNSVKKEYLRLDEDGIIRTTELFDEEPWLSEINYSELPNLLLIDEITHYSFYELAILNSISKKSYYSDNANFMKIIGAGDTSQLGYLAKVGDKYYNYNVESLNMIFVPKLWSTIRATNSQKKLNSEIMNRISSKVNSIYNENSRNLLEAEKLSQSFLEENDKLKLNLLTYYESDNELNGDKIISTLTLQAIKPLVNNIKENPNKIIGILTEDGELNDEQLKIFTDAGLISQNGEMKNLRIFTPKNIQGSEVDYFIFDAALSNKYDKVRDKIKSIYTYITRSKDGSLIIDSENIMRDNFKIVQGEKEKITHMFELLTPDKINKIKENKKKFYESLVGENAKPSDDDNFKWKIGKDSQKDIGSSRFVLPIPEVDLSDKPSDIKNLEDKELKQGFKLMLHSFYNNPGAKVAANGNIKVNINNNKFDLNGINSLNGDDAKKFTNDWVKLKNYLIYNQGDDSIITTQFQDYFNNIFAGLNGSEVVNLEFVITASNMDKSINTPYKKAGLMEELVLKDGEAFINLSAKLKFGQQEHYVTLATFGTREQILKKATEYKVSKNEINKKFDEIENNLKSEKLIEYKLNNSDITYLTSTLLQKIKKKNSTELETYTLDELYETFPGLNTSEIRFIPHTRSLFKNLFDRHNFGEKRQMEIIQDVNGNETFKDKDIEERYQNIKNKPYIVVSYNNDTDGDNNNDTFGKIVMIGSQKRGMKTLISEVEELLDQRKEELHQNVKINGLSESSIKISNELNVKSEILLNRNDILDVLITWGTTKTNNTTNPDETYLDLLFKELPFKQSDFISGEKTSVFEIFSRFNNTGKQLTNERLNNVINKVKKGIKDNKGDKVKIKKDIIASLEGTLGWHWSFFNIFAYDKIIKDFTNSEFMKLYADGVLTEEGLNNFNNSEGEKQMIEILEKLMEPIKNFKFYYSLPIKGNPDGSIRANDLVNGSTGFSKDMFADKFFIDVAPESSRLMFDINGFLNLEKNEINIAPEQKVEETPEEETVEETVKPEEVFEINNTSDLMKKAISDFKEDKDGIPGVSKLIQSIVEINSSLFEDINNVLFNSELYKNTNDLTVKLRVLLQELGISFNQDNSVKIASIAQMLAKGGIKPDTLKTVEIKKLINNLTTLKC